MLYRAAIAALVYAAVVVALVTVLLMLGCRKEPETAPKPVEAPLSQQERDLRHAEACAFRNVQTRIHEDAERSCRNIGNYPTSIERLECLEREEFAWAKIQPKVAAANELCEAGRVSD